MNMFSPMILSMIFLFSMISMINFFFIFKKSSKNNSKEFMKSKKTPLLMSLFTSFDAQSNLSILFFKDLNWLIIILSLMILNFSYWVSPTRMNFMFKSFLVNFKIQFEIALKSKKDSSSLTFLSFFTFIMLMNLLGLVPNLFTPTSHIVFNLIFSVSLWTGFFFFGWMKFTNKMFAHLVPLSTPTPLISFMVLIETISTMIRPGTLSIRLMANMVSGHLLLTLMGNSMAMKPLLIIIILVIVQSLLSSLELGVSFIQAYVFCMLLTLYSDESEYKV